MATQELTSAIAADANLAERLDLPEGSPVLLIEMLSFTYKDDPYEYRRSSSSPARRSSGHTDGPEVIGTSFTAYNGRS